MPRAQAGNQDRETPHVLGMLFAARLSPVDITHTVSDRRPSESELKFGDTSWPLFVFKDCRRRGQ